MSIVDGKYKIIRPLGAGAMGEVFLANDLRLERPVALKFLNARIARKSKARTRFLEEGKRLAKLKAENLGAIYDCGEQDDRPYMVLEYIDGTSLEKVIKRGPVPVNVAIPIIAEVLDGLAHAHSKGIVHRDIKPSNIIITPDGHPKVIDFGIAVDQDAERMTVVGDQLGTPAYASPEQSAGRTAEIDQVSDVYSVGAVLFEMLTGKPPLEKENNAATFHAHATEVVPPLPEKFGQELTAVVSSALALQKEDRYQSTDAFKTGLRAAVPLPIDALAHVVAYVRPPSRETVFEPDEEPNEVPVTSKRRTNRSKPDGTKTRGEKPGGSKIQESRTPWTIYASVVLLALALIIGMGAKAAHDFVSKPIPRPTVLLPVLPLPTGWDTVSPVKADPQPKPDAPKVIKAPRLPALSEQEKAELEARRSSIENDIRTSNAKLKSWQALGETSKAAEVQAQVAALREQLDAVMKKLSAK